MNALTALDTNLFVLLNQQLTSPFLDFVMPVVTEFDNWRYPLVLVILGVFWRGSTPTRMGFLFAILAVIVADQVSSAWMKPFFERLRPFHVVEGTRQLVDAHSFSFPSSHAANTFAAGAFLALRFRKLWPALAIPILVGYSRVYVGVHYPLDVLGGAAVGAAIAFVFVAIERAAEIRVTDLLARRRRGGKAEDESEDPEDGAPRP